MASVMKVGQHRPRMAPKRARVIIRTVVPEYRTDYCRLAGMGYSMILSHYRYSEARGRPVMWVMGRADLMARLAKPKPNALWHRLWWRSRLPSQPK